ncbi:hypothetical protein C7H09_01395 [Marinobacter fuscus]|uniref:PadR family transcriptional regulator n=1 Tax=Marinobacter fuscus TaxID=2109942 RepID=A0A2T1KT60_9GAMM|nr:PadR family transcriptional regulator [Marinobacter fuscus]PSF13296.1 hypothetical protein C7H09_01395 [Marinobacter fuscus]
MIFNTTTYLVLGILLREPKSGYDIVKELASFRPAKSSQIYPILAKLEANGFVDCTQVQQDGKPNKKVYSVTSTGKAKLEAWLDTEPEPPVIRDDFLSMVYSVWIKEPETLERLIKDRKTYMEQRLDFFTEKLAVMEASFPADIHNFYSWRHCTRLLYSRRIAMTAQEIEWCNDVLKDHALARRTTEA